MVVYYFTDTGLISGTIEGRRHTPQQLNMWVGDKDKTERIIIDWKISREYEEIIEKEVQDGYGQDEEGFDFPIMRTIRQKVRRVEYEPDHKQKDLIMDFVEGRKTVYDYKINLSTLLFEPVNES